MAERAAAVDTARCGLTKEEQAVFDGGLQSNLDANFTWWQDDHNYCIDLNDHWGAGRWRENPSSPPSARRPSKKV